MYDSNPLETPQTRNIRWSWRDRLEALDVRSTDLYVFPLKSCVSDIIKPNETERGIKSKHWCSNGADVADAADSDDDDVGVGG